MKNIIAFAAGVAAFVSFASVANAQTQEVPVVPTETTFDISPYVDLRYVTKPHEDNFFGGNGTKSVIVLGTEATLPWDITFDGNVRIQNNTRPHANNVNNVDTSAFDLGGFETQAVRITLTKEVMDNVEVYTTTKFNSNLNREFTKFGGRWYFQ